MYSVGSLSGWALTEGAQGLGVPQVPALNGREVRGPEVGRGAVVAGQVVVVRAQIVQRVPPRIAHNRGHRCVRAGVHETPVIVRPVRGRISWEAYTHQNMICGVVCVW